MAQLCGPPYENTISFFTPLENAGSQPAAAHNRGWHNQTVFMRNVFKVRWVAPVLSEASVCYMRFLPIRPLPLHIWSDPPACYLYGRRRFLPLSQRATRTAWKSAVPFNCSARLTGKCAFVFPYIFLNPSLQLVSLSHARAE